jgi:hypothetical protein
MYALYVYVYVYMFLVINSIFLNYVLNEIVSSIQAREDIFLHFFSNYKKFKFFISIWYKLVE